MTSCQAIQPFEGEAETCSIRVTQGGTLGRCPVFNLLAYEGTGEPTWVTPHGAIGSAWWDGVGANWWADHLQGGFPARHDQLLIQPPPARAEEGDGSSWSVDADAVLLKHDVVNGSDSDILESYAVSSCPSGAGLGFNTTIVWNAGADVANAQIPNTVHFEGTFSQRVGTMGGFCHGLICHSKTFQTSMRTYVGDPANSGPSHGWELCFQEDLSEE